MNDDDLVKFVSPATVHLVKHLSDITGRKRMDEPSMYVITGETWFINALEISTFRTKP